MSATLQDLQDAITAVGVAVAADATQDQAVITVIEALIAKLNSLPAAADYTNEVAALSSVISTLQSSNATVQAELDKASA